MSELVSLAYSPWSERARWALDHHGVAYDKVEYVPMLGEPQLRWRLKNFWGKVSVPIYFDGELTLTDSFDIARRADEVGKGPSLFPAGKHAEISRWNDRAEQIMSAGRAATVIRVRRDPEAKREALRGIVPDPLRGVLLPVATFGAEFLAYKYYGRALATESQLRDQARAALVELAAALEGRQLILDDLSYADIVMAVSLQFVEPVSDRYIRLGSATRRCWTDVVLAKEFPHLLDWRDQLYAEHRQSSSARSKRTPRSPPTSSA